VWGGGVPLPTGEEYGDRGGSVPSPEKCLILNLKTVRFDAFWVVFIAAEWLVLHAKQALNWSFQNLMLHAMSRFF